MNGFDIKEFKKHLQDFPVEIDAVISSEKHKIFDSAEVKILHARLTTFWEGRPNKQVYFALCINESELKKLEFNDIQPNLDTHITETLKTSLLIHVDNSFSVLSTENVRINTEVLTKFSKENRVVFFFGENGVDIIVRGEIIRSINIFYNEEDRLKYYKKHHITHLQLCLKEYEKHIKQPGINQSFFASKTLIARLQSDNPPNNTLHNKPESILRDHLIDYLNKNTQHTFSKENELNNQRELDLYAEVEGRKYLIEVKWLGQSINDSETGFSARVTDYSARDGVNQTLEYIQELIEKMNFNVHCGYLCVFDAREEPKQVNYENYEFVTPELRTYFTNHFIKLDEIVLSRNIPHRKY